MFDAVVSVIEREYFDRRFLAEAWPALRDEHRARFMASTSEEERAVTVTRLLEAVGVSHLALLTPDIQAKIADAGDNPHRLKPEWSREGKTLWVAIRSCKVPTTRRADLVAIAEELGRVDEVVLDLRLNDGGSGGVVSDVVSLFVEPETPVLRMRDRRGLRDGEPHVVHTFPEEENLDHELEVATIRQSHDVEYRTHGWAGVRFEGRLVVLTDRTCYSCGEVLAQALKEHTDATIAGRSTAGMVVAARQVEVGEGYGLLVPFAEMRAVLAALRDRGLLAWQQTVGVSWGLLESRSVVHLVA